MRWKMVISVVVLIILGSTAFLLAQDDSTEAVVDSAVVDTTQAADSVAGDDRFVVYYFHGDRRCATCYKLETYSQEAVEEEFEKELKDSSVVWQPVNYDKEDNEHFIGDYKLYTKAVIISRTKNGKELGWMNLDKIWELVGDKDEFITYVQKEARAFVSQESEE